MRRICAAAGGGGGGTKGCCASDLILSASLCDLGVWSREDDAGQVGRQVRHQTTREGALRGPARPAGPPARAAQHLAPPAAARPSPRCRHCRCRHPAAGPQRSCPWSWWTWCSRPGARSRSSPCPLPRRLPWHRPRWGGHGGAGGEQAGSCSALPSHLPPLNPAPLPHTVQAFAKQRGLPPLPAGHLLAYVVGLAALTAAQGDAAAAAAGKRILRVAQQGGGNLLGQAESFAKLVIGSAGMELVDVLLLRAEAEAHGGYFLRRQLPGGLRAVRAHLQGWRQKEAVAFARWMVDCAGAWVAAGLGDG